MSNIPKLQRATSSASSTSVAPGGMKVISPVEAVATQSLDEAAVRMEEEGEGDAEDGEDDDEEGDESFAMDGGQELINETTVKSAYLYKRGEKRKNWKKRWFVLRSAKLYYYKNDKEYQLLRFIDMSEVQTIAPVELKKVEHCFGISTSKRQYYVRASSAKEMQSWVEALRSVREQVRQQSTITRDMSTMDIGAPSLGGENHATSAAVRGTAAARGTGFSASPQVAPNDQNPVLANKANSSKAISIMIPGKGLYTAPAQPRKTASGSVVSPLSSTSDSEAGTATGVEQFGLSYTSSASQSLAGSPSRAGLPPHFALYAHDQGSGNTVISPLAYSASEEQAEALRRTRMTRRPSAGRDASVGGSSGGEGASSQAGAVVMTGDQMRRQRSSSQVGNQVLSSSDDDGEGDEWDEEEEADQAMPLPSPGGLNLLAVHGHNHGTLQTPKGGAAVVDAPAAMTTPSKPKVGPEFFKDSNKVIHQAYLMKQSNRRKHWRKRWFTLTSGSLSYTRSHMDSRPHKQIPLSSILDATEYTSKKAFQPSGPLSPSLSAFGGANPLHFSRSPLLGGGGGGSDANASGAAERRQASVQSKPSGSSLGATSDAERGAISGSEVEGTAGPERKPSVHHDESKTSTPAPAKKRKENCFKIITPKRIYVICAPTEEEELKWLSALRALLAHLHEKDGAGEGQVTPVGTSEFARPSEMSGTGSQGASPLPSGGAAQTGTFTRHNAPSISIAKPQRREGQDDARATPA